MKLEPVNYSQLICIEGEKTEYLLKLYVQM
jgi:hypothetical protein